MPYFLNKLQKLSTDTPLEFKINVICLLFQYELFPHLDKGDFSKCIEIISHYKENLYDKESWLNPIRKSELLLYTAIVHIGNHDFKQAKNISAIQSSTIIYVISPSCVQYGWYASSPIMRFKTLSSSNTNPFLFTEGLEARKKNNLSRQNTSYSIFSINAISLYLKKDRETLWEKLSPEINSLHNDKYENQLLRIFDFTAWIEAKILKEKLSDVLARHSEVKKYHSK